MTFEYVQLCSVKGDEVKFLEHLKFTEQRPEIVLEIPRLNVKQEQV